MRVLIVATRDPRGRQTGRKAVLNTMLRSLRSLGHEVDLAVVARHIESGAVPDGVRVHRVPPPHVWRIALTVLLRVLRGRLSLNESLYWSPTAARRVTELAERQGSDVVVADMIRTFPLAHATGLPMVVDLDDLLSERYRQMATGGDTDRAVILGYYRENLPSPLVGAVSLVAAVVCRWEARLLVRRELEAAALADVVSLVSREEAATFQARAGLRVDALPMAVDIPPEPLNPVANPALSAVFVGGLDYYANLQSIRWFSEHVLGELRRNGDAAFCLTVVGHCPEAVREELSSPQLELVGYVDDLASELARHRMFVAPIVSGTGVKTKVLEAMAIGLPVVSTALGVEGIGIVDGKHCLLADDGPEFAAAIRRLADDSGFAASIGAAARVLIVEAFSLEVVTDKWGVVLDRLARKRPR